MSGWSSPEWEGHGDGHLACRAKRRQVGRKLGQLTRPVIAGLLTRRAIRRRCRCEPSPRHSMRAAGELLRGTARAGSTLSPAAIPAAGWGSERTTSVTTDTFLERHTRSSSRPQGWIRGVDGTPLDDPAPAGLELQDRTATPVLAIGVLPRNACKFTAGYNSDMR